MGNQVKLNLLYCIPTLYKDAKYQTIKYSFNTTTPKHWYYILSYDTRICMCEKRLPMQTWWWSKNVEHKKLMSNIMKLLLEKYKWKWNWNYFYELLTTTFQCNVKQDIEIFESLLKKSFTNSEKSNYWTRII